MSKIPNNRKQGNPAYAKPEAQTGHGGLYDRNGPIPVPEAKESDSESAWAMFQESVMIQDNPPTTIQPMFEETKTDGNPETTGFEPTDFGGSGYDETTAAPLKP